MATVANLNVNLGVNSGAFQAGLDKASHKLNWFARQQQMANETMRTSGMKGTIQMLRGAGAAAVFEMAGRALNSVFDKMVEALDKVASGQMTAAQALIYYTDEIAKSLPVFGQFYTLGQKIRAQAEKRLFGTETPEDILRGAAAVEERTKAMQKEVDFLTKRNQAIKAAVTAAVGESEKGTAASRERIKEIEDEERVAHIREREGERSAKWLASKLEGERKLAAIKEKIEAAEAKKEAAPAPAVSRALEDEISRLQTEAEAIRKQYERRGAEIWAAPDKAVLDSIDEMTTGLKDQAETYGMTARAAEIYRMAAKVALMEPGKAADLAKKKLEEMKDAADELTTKETIQTAIDKAIEKGKRLAEEEEDRLGRFAASIKEKQITPIERYEEQINKLGKALTTLGPDKKALISWEQYGEAVKDANAELGEASKKPPERRAEFAVLESVRVSLAGLAGGREPKAEELAKDQIKKIAETNDLLKKFLAEIGLS